MEPCPCGSQLAYSVCCEPLIRGTQNAQTAEALMRSRYTAHVKTEVDYIYETTLPTQRKNCDRDSVTAWSKKSEWQGLEVLKTEAGGPEDQSGTVEFIARYREKGKAVRHHEIAEFAQNEGRWYFKDGHAPKAIQAIRQGPKIGRNDPCPCGSGKKSKKCCGG